MGWVNYIIVPDWKMKFVVTRSFEEDEELFEKINNLSLTQEALHDCEALDKQIKSLTMGDVRTVIDCAKSINPIYFDEFPASGLILFLKSRKIDFEIISETNPMMEKYKKFKIVE